MKKSMERRDFLKKTGAGVAAAGTVGVLASSQPAFAQSKKKYRWNMVTTWPPKLPLLQTGAERFAKKVDDMSDGRLKIKVYAGGELVPPLQTFDAVSQGTVQAGAGASYYWAGKVPAAQWFAAVPFGLNAQGMNAWFYGGGGLELWEEIYAPFNVIPRPGGNTGVQAGGWYNKEINRIDDFKGLKMRIPGLGGKVLKKAGGTPVLKAGGEIFISLERKVIDATEWVGPLHDLRMGFYKAAKYYYWPGWHEPGTTLEFIFNKGAYEGLPKDLQTIIDTASAETNLWTLANFDAQNGAALQTLIKDHKVSVRTFPADVLSALRKLAEETVEEEAAKDANTRKVAAAFKAFQKQVGQWGSFSEKTYHNLIATM